MSIALYAFTCGHLTIPFKSFLEGEEGLLTVPVPAYLLVHPKGSVLFDTGLNPHAVDPNGSYFDSIHPSNQIRVSTPELLNARFEQAGLDIAGVTHVINSHLHYDHAGGNSLAPDVPILIQKRELDHARAVGTAGGYVSADFETGQSFTMLNGEHDLFGDGSIVCMPTFGHTPGHQSLKVTTTTGTYILAGDACYLRRTLDDMHLPRFRYNDEQMLASLRALKALQQRGARIMYGHDPEFWETVPQAPVRLA
ncbi:N-acyl homoserine lactonase family protein [Pyruvatibacter sp.]|uniref:N-acyl homoserine lactonase family protein n=1 Tax=Pyruvatibacter sp. TaxID=1981328 RepID=UPI0032EA944C